MPNEMNHAEIAKILDEMAEHEEWVDCENPKVEPLRQAAADERRIANDEYAPVVHAHWTKKYDSGSQNYNSDENWDYVCSKCGRWDKIPEKYCHCCGALMDGKGDSYETD